MMIKASFTIAVLFALTLQAPAASGTLDPTFFETGESVVGFGGVSQIILSGVGQSDGKFVFAGLGTTELGVGEFEIIRFDTNNALDATFGEGGVAFTAYPGTDATPNAVAIQPDGKIIAAGAAGADFALVRYNTNGTLDLSFGTGGLVDTPLSAKFSGINCVINAIALQQDGKIIVAGGINGTVAVARYLTNGVLDTTFGTNGVTAFNTGGAAVSSVGATGVLVQPSGTIVVVAPAGSGSEFAVLRYTTNGVFDTSFGGTGVVLTPVPAYTNGLPTEVGYQSGSIPLRIPDKIVVAGDAGPPGSSYLLLTMRYNLDGSLDTSFNGTGIVTNAFAKDVGQNYCTGMQIRGGLDGTITLAGTAFGFTTGSNFMGMIRINDDGTVNTAFGPSGTGQALVPIATPDNIVTSGTGALAMNSSAYEMGYSLGVEDNGNRSLPIFVQFSSAGIPNTSFGTNGILVEDVSSQGASARGLAVQSDGKIVAAGANAFSPTNIDGFALARYNPDGSLDGAFGLVGRVITIMSPTNPCEAAAVALQSDGKIVAAGSVETGASGLSGPEYEFALVRYLTNGILDSSFGSGGVVKTSTGGAYDNITAVALQSDRKIVAAGASLQVANDDFAVVRYATNGALDTSFGGTGKVVTAVGGGESKASGMAIQSDGKIVLAGFAKVASTTNFALARYLTNGTLDSSFGSSGTVTTDFGAGICSANALAMQPDGKFIAAGNVVAGGVYIFAVARYLTNGALDTSFGSGGKVTTTIGSTNAFLSAVALLPNGKIAVDGYTSSNQCAIVRYNPDGSPDATFAPGGILITKFEGRNDPLYALAVDQIGRLLFGGSANGLMGVGRLIGDPYLFITSINVSSNSVASLQGFGIPATNNTLQFSTNLLPGSFRPVTPVATDAGGFWQTQDSNAQGAVRFYRLSFP